MWQTPQSGSSAAPLVQSFILHRMMHLHQSLADALDASVQITMWDKAAWAERQQLMEFVTPEQAEIIARQRAES